MNTKTVDTSSTTSLRVVAFPVGQLTLSVPIESVYRVLSQVPVYGSGERGVGVAHLEDYELTVFDLEYKIFTHKNEESIQGSHIVVVQSHQEVLGLLVKQTPSLMTLPRDRVRVLPASYRKADSLSFCSHVAVVEQQEQEQESITVFLLDVDRLIPR